APPCSSTEPASDGRSRRRAPGSGVAGRAPDRPRPRTLRRAPRPLDQRRRPREHPAMTVPTRISPFEVPSLPPMAALRDRSEEAAERSMRLREDGYVAGYQAGLDAAAQDVAREVAEHRAAAERLSAA